MACLGTVFTPTDNPEVTLTGGLEEPRSLDHYAEYYLAFAMVEEVNGTPAVVNLIRRLTRDADYESAFKEATGLGFTEFKSRALAWTRERLHRALEGRAEILAAREKLRRGRCAEARSLYEAFLNARTDSGFRTFAIAELGYCQFRLGDLVAARASLRSARDGEPRCYLNKYLDFTAIQVAESERDWPAATEMCRRYLKDHISSSPEGTLEVQRVLKRAEVAMGVKPSQGDGNGGR